MRSAWQLNRPKAEKSKTFRLYEADQEAFRKLSELTGLNQSAVLRLVLQMGIESPNALLRVLHNSWKRKRLDRTSVNTNAQICPVGGGSMP
jgi:hypothetical protein